MTIARPATCIRCEAPLEPARTGRPRLTCSHACRQAVWDAAHPRRRRSVHHSSESVEWYTPPDLFERVAAQHGPFDLDPATDPRSPIWPLVERHWTVADDGLAQPWNGKIWCNPPYGRTIRLWTRKAAEEFAAGRASRVVLLVPARPDTGWWNEALEAGAVPEFIRGRVRFVLPDGTRLAGAPFPSALLVFCQRTELHSGGDR